MCDKFNTSLGPPELEGWMITHYHRIYIRIDRWTITLEQPRTPAKSTLVFNFPHVIPEEALWEEPQSEKFSRADDLDSQI